jgi:hypothetical protein
VHIPLVNLCEQAHEYVFNENSTFQMVRSTRSTPNNFDASGSGDLPPPPPMTPVETFHGHPNRSVVPDSADVAADGPTDATRTSNGS